MEKIIEFLKENKEMTKRELREYILDLYDDCKISGYSFNSLKNLMTIIKNEKDETVEREIKLIIFLNEKEKVQKIIKSIIETKKENYIYEF